MIEFEQEIYMRGKICKNICFNMFKYKFPVPILDERFGVIMPVRGYVYSFQIYPNKISARIELDRLYWQEVTNKHNHLILGFMVRAETLEIEYFFEMKRPIPVFSTGIIIKND